MPIIVIDPGHGGENRGGEYGEFVEKEINPIVAQASTCPSTTIYTVRRCGFHPVENYTARDLLLQRLKCRSLLTWDYFRVASRPD